MKKFNKKQQPQKETQIEWRNIPHEAKFNPTKNWYGVVDFDKAPSVVITYTSNFRSEAVAIFNEEARLLGGKLSVVSVFK